MPLSLFSRLRMSFSSSSARSFYDVAFYGGSFVLSPPMHFPPSPPSSTPKTDLGRGRGRVQQGIIGPGFMEFQFRVV